MYYTKQGRCSSSVIITVCLSSGNPCPKLPTQRPKYIYIYTYLLRISINHFQRKTCHDSIYTYIYIIYILTFIHRHHKCCLLVNIEIMFIEDSHKVCRCDVCRREGCRLHFEYGPVINLNKVMIPRYKTWITLRY